MVVALPFAVAVIVQVTSGVFSVRFVVLEKPVLLENETTDKIIMIAARTTKGTDALPREAFLPVAFITRIATRPNRIAKPRNQYPIPYPIRTVVSFIDVALATDAPAPSNTTSIANITKTLFCFMSITY